MTQHSKPAYRETILPGFGRMHVPADMSDDQILAQLQETDEEATPKKKSKKPR